VAGFCCLSTSWDPKAFLCYIQEAGPWLSRNRQSSMQWFDLSWSFDIICVGERQSFWTIGKLDSNSIWESFAILEVFEHHINFIRPFRLKVKGRCYRIYNGLDSFFRHLPSCRCGTVGGGFIPPEKYILAAAIQNWEGQGAEGRKEGITWFQRQYPRYEQIFLQDLAG
jgi:hypothetical protein